MYFLPIHGVTLGSDHRPNPRDLEKSQLMVVPTAMPRSSRPKCSSITAFQPFHSFRPMVRSSDPSSIAALVGA
jgi:hypothetical protein